MNQMMCLELKINALNVSRIETKEPKSNHVKNRESTRIGKLNYIPPKTLGRIESEPVSSVKITISMMGIAAADKTQQWVVY